MDSRIQKTGKFFKNILSRDVINVSFTDPGHAQKNTLSDSITSYSNEFKEVYPVFRFEFIDTLSWLATFNPDVSQTVKKIISLGNVGHTLEFSGAGERAIEAAASELNDFARNKFPNNAGADGFINQQFRQIIVKGALCQETVPSVGLKEVEEVYQVRTSTIRFKFEDGKYLPYQQLGIREIPLNEQTFSYVPLYTEEDNPYAIPPFVSALRGIIRQERQWLGIDDFTDKWGLMGLVHLAFDLRKEFNESDTEFRRRSQDTLKKHVKAFKSNIKDGIIATGKNTEFKHNNVSKNAGQMKDILESNHQALTSGLDIDPAILGYTYSTTETYAEMVYMTLVNQIQNIWRIIKRGNEHSYNLHLALRRIPAVCSMQSKAPPSLNRKEEVEADEIKQRMVYQRLDKGTIDEDQAARELGYDEAYQKPSEDNDKTEGLVRLKFDYSKSREKYEFIKPRIVTLGKKKSDNEYKRIAELEEDYSTEFFEIYRVKYNEVLSGLDAHFKTDDVAEAIMNDMNRKMSHELPDESLSVIKDWTGKAYKMGLGQDWSDDKWKVTDKDALKFFKKHDQHFFGKQFEHYSDDMRKVVEDELKGTARAYDKETVKRMKESLGEAFEHPYVNNYYDLCIRNAVNKSRNYGRVFKYERLGIAEVEVVAILDKKTSRICRVMNGRRISVKYLAEHVREVLKTPMNELTEKYAWPNEKQAKEYHDMSTKDILDKTDCPMPPYHGRCRTTTVIAKKIKINKSSSDETFSGNINYDSLNETAKKRASILNKLKKDELLSKVDSQVKTSWWEDKVREWPDGTTRKSKEYHASKHGKEFEKTGSYDKSLKKVLLNYDKVYTFGEESIEWIYFDSGTGSFLQINDESKILRFHKFRRFKPGTHMVEIK